jgi:fluoride ion exporter CrcB/FEX
VAHPPRLLPLIGGAGAVGACLRWTVLSVSGLSHTAGPTDPEKPSAIAGSGLTGRTMVALLVLNVVGSLIAGGASEAARQGWWSARRTSAVVVGFCGGLTTFSTVTVEVARRLTDGGATGAVSYLLVSIGTAVAAVLFGRMLAGRWYSRSGRPFGVAP